MTTDRAAAMTWMAAEWPARGVEGVVAKRLDAPYRAGRGVGAPWVKIKQRVIGDARVVGITGTLSDPAAVVLGPLTGDTGDPRPVGVPAPLSRLLRTELTARLRGAGEPRTLPGSVSGLPGSPTRWLPVHPYVVVEVEADPVLELGRWRHRPRVLRLRSSTDVDRDSPRCGPARPGPGHARPRRSGLGRCGPGRRRR